MGRVSATKSPSHVTRMDHLTNMKKSPCRAALAITRRSSAIPTRMSKETARFTLKKTTQKGSKCYQYITDYKLDSNNKQIYNSMKVTEIPCSCGGGMATQVPSPTPEKTVTPPPQYTLEAHWEGAMSGGNVSIEWGPETSQIPLKLKENSNNEYEGSFQGKWHAKISGECVGSGEFPVTIEVQAVDNGEDMDLR